MRAHLSLRLVLFIALMASSRGSLADVAQRIPQVPGMTVTAVVSEPKGDREAVFTIRSVGADFYEGVYSAEVEDRGRGRSVEIPRRVRMRDHLGAHVIRSEFWEGDAHTFSGTTPFLSRAIIEELRRGSSTVSDHYTTPMFGMRISQHLEGTLKRVAFENVPVLVNGRPVHLRAMRARGTFEDSAGGPAVEVEVLALDDLENPLFLGWRDDQGESRVVRIDYPDTEAARARLETALRRREPFDIYVHFAFGSAELRAPSRTTLADVAAVLAKHADWKLSILGHTDNIGSDAANIALSTQRANAVRDALIKDHGIAADRLSASGRGAAGAIAPNATPEGRARNRRVVLSRE